MLRRLLQRKKGLLNPLTTNPLISLDLAQKVQKSILPPAKALMPPAAPRPLDHNPQQFFNPLVKSISPYVLGPILSKDYIKKHQKEIAASKQELLYLFRCSENQNLLTFIDVLFDFERAAQLIGKIDTQVAVILNKVDPQLFVAYQRIAHEKKPEALQPFLQSRFLPSLRKTFSALASHYGYDPQLIETNDGTLMNEDYMDLVQNGKLVLDLGEDGHGPLAHLIAALIIREIEMEKDDRLHSAPALYQSLSLPCHFYCTNHHNYMPRFYLLLDFEKPYPPLTQMVFCNPASLANHLLLHGQALKPFATLCKIHAQDLLSFSLAEWEHRSDKTRLVRGKIMTL